MLRAERAASPAPGCEVSNPLVELLRLSRLDRSEPGGKKNKNENNKYNNILIKGRLRAGE